MAGMVVRGPGIPHSHPGAFPLIATKVFRRGIRISLENAPETLENAPEHWVSGNNASILLREHFRHIQCCARFVVAGGARDDAGSGACGHRRQPRTRGHARNVVSDVYATLLGP